MSETSAQAYVPTENDVVKVLELLYNNGINVQSNKSAYHELLQYQSTPFFSILLSHIFKSPSCPLPNSSVPGAWIQYRQLAGITLKNNLETARHTLGEEAVAKAAQCSLEVLKASSDIRLSRTAAMIVSKITSLTSIEWWAKSGICNLPELLLRELVDGGGLKTMSGLYALQYLMEDSPKQIGEGCSDIVTYISNMIIQGTQPLEVRKAAFRMCSNVYERASGLDWCVDVLSPLQSGLCNASLAFSRVCTVLIRNEGYGDSVLVIESLRTCSVMVEYLEHFAPRLTSEEANGMIECWVRRPIHLLAAQPASSSMTLSELKSAAIEVLNAILSIYQRNGGDGPIVFLTNPILDLLPTLIPHLVMCVPLSDEEVNNVVSGDNDPLTYTSSTIGQLLGDGNKKADISEDKQMDDEQAAMSLRSSAVRCVEYLCALDGNRVFPLLFKEIVAWWNDENWRKREAAIALTGAAAEECYFNLASSLNNLVPELLRVASDGQQHVCTISSVMWVLSRVYQWILVDSKGAALPSVMSAVLNNMPVQSNRVQASAVSTLTILVNQACELNIQNMIAPFVPEIVQTLHRCLPVYGGINYASLCVFAITLAPLIPPQQLGYYTAPFYEDRTRRAQTFVESYTSVYVNEVPNALLRKEIFAIDNVCAEFLTQAPNPSFSLSALSTWRDVIKDIVARGVADDPELIRSAAYTCYHYVVHIPTHQLAEWCTQSTGDLSSSAFAILTKNTDDTVRVSSAVLLRGMIKGAGHAAYPPGLADEILKKTPTMLEESEDPQVKAALMELATAVISNYPNVESAHPAAIRVLGGHLRSDVFGDSLYYYTRMACAMCDALNANAKFVDTMPIEVIAQLLAQSENSYEKAVATCNLTVALSLTTLPEKVNALQGILRLVYSWQNAAGEFPGLQESISAAALSMRHQCPNELNQHLQKVPAAFRQMLASNYGF